MILRPNAADETDMLVIEIGKIVGVFLCQYIVRGYKNRDDLWQLIRLSYRDRMKRPPGNPFYLGV